MNPGNSNIPVVLDIQGLTVSLGENESVPILSDVSFKLKAGEVLAITGVSGAGKSTLIKALLGILDSGLSVSGSMNHHSLSSLKGHTGLRSSQPEFTWMPQDVDFALDRHAPIDDQLTLMLGYRLGTPLSTARDSLYNECESVDRSLVTVLASRPVDVSRGQLQRILVIHALMGTEPVLLADEPTSALDPVNRNAFMLFLSEQVRRRNKSVIIASHDFELIAGYCDRLIHLTDAVISDDLVLKPSWQASSSDNLKDMLNAAAQLSDGRDHRPEGH